MSSFMVGPMLSYRKLHPYSHNQKFGDGPEVGNSQASYVTGNLWQWTNYGNNYQNCLQNFGPLQNVSVQILYATNKTEIDN